jgi:hypothetical protein
MNAYAQLEFIRDLIAETSPAHWSSLNLLRRLNLVQSKLALKLSMTPGDWLTKSKSITATDSLIELPFDCMKPIYLENSDGAPVPFLSGGVNYRRVSRSISPQLVNESSEVYPLSNSLEINAASYSGALTLWYQKRVPDLHCGYVDTGSASTLILDKSTTEGSNDLGTGRAINFIDVYNGSGVLDIRSIISDFTASTATVTITGTPTANDQYGTVSVLPEECHMYMTVETAAIALMKPGSKLDKEALQYVQSLVKQYRDEFNNWISTRVAASSSVAYSGN